MAKELEKMGTHILAIKDMAGLLRPFAARSWSRRLRNEVGVPIHFHTHDTGGIKPGIPHGRRGRSERSRFRRVLHERHDQPAQHERGVGRAQAHPARYGPRPTP